MRLKGGKLKFFSCLFWVTCGLVGCYGGIFFGKSLHFVGIGIVKLLTFGLVANVFFYYQNNNTNTLQSLS